MLPMFTLTLSDLDNGCWGLVGYTLLNKLLCWEKKRGKVIMGWHKARLRKKAENLTVCWVCKAFLCLLKSVKCALCVHEQVHTHTSFVQKQLCILLCVWVDPDDSRGKLSVREGQLRQAEGWAAAASGLGHSLFMVQAWAFTDHCHSLAYTHICTDYFIPSLYMIEKDWEGEGKGGMKRKGEKEKVKNGC